MSENKKNNDEIILRALHKLIKAFEKLEHEVLQNTNVLNMIDEIVNPEVDTIYPGEIVRFTKEQYKEICKHCGSHSITFMAIA
jgi:DUF438 domain-containing protein|tara:strand:+ start:761 stop:1009 length:249 start_codon:yes stop_codon:yes gene_type:complete